MRDPVYDEVVDPRSFAFELERRTFVKILGGGLLVLATAGDLLAQESGRGGMRQGNAEPAGLAAWLHIDEQGRITACTGKVEIGQNIRTSLSQAVADELHVPIAHVTLLMGDTDKCPFDMGTFGSRTTPFMAPLMARAAAAARQMLVDRAAATWQADASTLTVSDGTIVARDGRRLSYGEITKGQTLTGTIPANPPIERRAEWHVRGTAVPKVNGRDFVTGRHHYTPDVTRPGLLHGRIVRPEAYDATILSFDDSRARAMPGVTVVRDNAFIGVVAPTERAAIRAAKAVDVRWQPPADQPSSDTIYDYLVAHPERGGGPPRAVGSNPLPPGAREFRATYRVPYIAHVPLEPRAAVAEWTGDGRLTVWTGSQRPWGVRGELAAAFHMPEERVRVIVPDFGSAYGGKHTGECAVEAARLAKAVNRPVTLVWTRPEEFTWAYFRPAGVIDLRSATDARGRIVLWEHDNVNSGPAGIDSQYDIAVKKSAFHPAETPLRQGSYRALAATANHYAREMQMDAMARALGQDQVAFRLAHLSDDRVRAVLQAAASKIGWPTPSAPGRALGIACGTEKLGYIGTAAEVSRTSDGFTVERIVIAFECGAIVNPDGLRNQVEGSVVQALGGALFESIQFRDGRILNGTLNEYRVPRFRDVPVIESVLLDRPDLRSVGAGEASLVCVAPAIGSAARAFGTVDAALPVRLTAQHA